MVDMFENMYHVNMCCQENYVLNSFLDFVYADLMAIHVMK